MSNKFDIGRLQEQFSHKNIISLEDITAFYREKEPSIPKTTVSWRIYSLVQQGELQRVGRGKYSFGETRHYSPKINYKMKKIGQLIKRKYPFINYCQWELSSVNMFSQHLINFNIHFVDVERDVVDPYIMDLKRVFLKLCI